MDRRQDLVTHLRQRRAASYAQAQLADASSGRSSGTGRERLRIRMLIPWIELILSRLR